MALEKQRKEEKRPLIGLGKSQQRFLPEGTAVGAGHSHRRGPGNVPGRGGPGGCAGRKGESPQVRR